VSFLDQVRPSEISVEEPKDKVILHPDGNITWIEGTKGKLFSDNKSLDLGKCTLDPRRLYQCHETEDKASPTMEVYYQMCQNCVELDSATLDGIIITDIIATLLLALGVYCFAEHETGRLSGAADTQALLRNDQLYCLRNQDDAEYSHLGGNCPQDK
uniref:CD3 gamma/delta subunit Ig-like domain-containing protein n=1 Tax=Loxodonta africana TaxID=9785 RepID=G3U502_LOXAF